MITRRGFLASLGLATLAVAVSILPRFGHHDEGETIAEAEEVVTLEVLDVDEVTKTITVRRVDGKRLEICPLHKREGYRWQGAKLLPAGVEAVETAEIWR